MMSETCTTCGGSKCVCNVAQTIRALEGKLALAEARERALLVKLEAVKRARPLDQPCHADVLLEIANK